MSFCLLEESARGVKMSASLPCVYREEDTGSYLSERDVCCLFFDNNRDDWFSSGDSHGDATGVQSHHGHNLASCSLDEGFSCFPNDEDPFTRTFEGTESDRLATASASSNRRNTLKNRMHRLLSRANVSLRCCWFPTSDSDSDC